MVGVTEVDVSHVVCVVEQIWVQSVAIQEDVLIVAAMVRRWEPMSVNHEAQASRQPECDVGPEHWTKEVEPGIDWSEQLVIWMIRKSTISSHIWERIVPC